MESNFKLENIPEFLREGKEKSCINKTWGNVAYNDKAIKCLICHHKCVAHNIYDIDYPYIDTKMQKSGWEPLSFRDISGKKYYCLNCNRSYGTRHEPKEIFYFERGAYFAGMLIYTILEYPDYMLFESFSGNEFHDMEDYMFRFPQKDITKLESVLKNTSSWEKSYENPDEIFDGYGWKIKFDYDGLMINTGGYEAYPLKFGKTIRKIQMTLERLCKKYAMKYSYDRIMEKIFL